MSRAPIIVKREICMPLHRRSASARIGGNFAGGMEINWPANGSIVRYKENIITRRDVKINRIPTKTRSKRRRDEIAKVEDEKERREGRRNEPGGVSGEKRGMKLTKITWRAGKRGG